MTYPQVRLTGWVTGDAEVHSFEDALEIMNDCEPVNRIARVDFAAAMLAGREVEGDMFTAQPVPCMQHGAPRYDCDCGTPA